MNLISLSYKNVIAKPLSSVLSVLLFGFGVSIIVAILLTSSFLKKEITKNASGIDLVVGAKGSPLQIILSSVFHIDFPTGNIALNEADNLAKNRLITSAIPMSLGDSYKGYRIVGTTGAYAGLYNAQLADGEWFADVMTATAGASVAQNVGLKVGMEISSEHGLAEGGSAHDEYPIKIVGIMKPTGTVIDQLILVSVQSVWKVHESHGENEEHHHESDSLHELVALKKLGMTVTREELAENDITTLLVQYRSPMAAVQLPRIVNETSNLQAASPPFETARLFSIIGVGVEVVNGLGIVVMLLSAVSVFIALFNSLKERKYELAIMRAMGAGRMKVFTLIIMEGLVLTIVGAIFGFALAHGGFWLTGTLFEEFSTSGFFFVPMELYVLVGSLVVGIFASIIPAILAYKADISEVLAQA